MKEFPMQPDRPSSKGDITAVVAITIMALAPLLGSGYFGDDGANVLTGAYLRFEHIGLFQHIRNVFGEWYVGNGRFYPLAFYSYPLFVYCPSLLVYKIGAMVAVIATIILFGRLLRELCVDGGLPLLAMLFPCLLFQFRVYHDPIMAFQYLLQVVLIQTFLSLLLFHRYLQTGRGWALVLSVILYGTSLLTYEITYTFFPLYVTLALAFSTDRRRAIRAVVPVLALTGVVVGFALYLRAHAVGIDPNYRPNLNLANYLHALGVQIAAGLPLIYFFCDPTGLGTRSWAGLLDHLDATLVVTASAGGYLYYRALGMAKLPSRRALLGLLALAGLLAVLPAVLVATSPKYQTAVLGLGYLQVYVQYFGVALLLALLFTAGHKLIPHPIARKMLRILVAVACAAVFAINLENNRLVVNKINRVLRYPRDMFGQGLRHGLLAEVPEGATLVVDSEYPWDTPYFVFNETGRRIKVIKLRDYYTTLATKTSSIGFEIRSLADQSVYFLKYDADSAGHGYAMCGKGDSMLLDLNRGEFAQIRVTNLAVFADVETPYRALIGKIRRDDENEGSLALLDFPPATTKQSDGFILSRLALPEGAVEFLSLDKIDARTDTFFDTGLFGPTDTHASDAATVLFPADGNRIAALQIGTNVVLRDTLSGKLVGVQHDTQRPISTAFPAGRSHVYTYAPTFELNREFSIEIVLRPGERQPSYAGILGNHPGVHNFEGFVIQQDGDQHNRFVFTVGNGREWLPGIKFFLPPNEWDYIGISVSSDGMAKVYVNGALAASTHYPTPCATGTMPLVIGDWINGDRTFNGSIREVALGKGPLDDDSIKHNWKFIRSHLLPAVNR